jgi:protein TonB
MAIMQLILSITFHITVLAVIALVSIFPKEQVIDVFVMDESRMVRAASGDAKYTHKQPGRHKAASGPKMAAKTQVVKQPEPEPVVTEAPAREAMVEQSSTAPPPESKAEAISTEVLPVAPGAAISDSSDSTEGSGRELPGPFSSGGSALQGGGQGDEMEFGQGTGPSFLHREVPSYPSFARKMGKEGRVLLRLTIDEMGKLVSADVLEDPGYGFAESALEAVRNSQFQPAMLDGKAAKSRALLSVRFVFRIMNERR